MNKNEFLKELDEIVKDPMFIGKGKEDLEEEILKNMWSISMSQQLADEFTVKEVREFLGRVIANRNEQIAKSNCNHGMLFYVWFDWLSGTLKFNLISDVHTNLPFKGQTEQIENLDLIIGEFITYPYHDGIELAEITDDKKSEENTPVNLTKVFCTELKYR